MCVFIMMHCSMRQHISAMHKVLSPSMSLKAPLTKNFLTVQVCHLSPPLDSLSYRFLYRHFPSDTFVTPYLVLCCHDKGLFTAPFMQRAFATHPVISTSAMYYTTNMYYITDNISDFIGTHFVKPFNTISESHSMVDRWIAFLDGSTLSLYFFLSPFFFSNQRSGESLFTFFFFFFFCFCFCLCLCFCLCFPPSSLFLKHFK